MSETEKTKTLLEEVYEGITELEIGVVKAQIERLPDLLKRNDVFIRITDENFQVKISKDIEEADGEAIMRILGLAGIYVTACEAEAENQFYEEIPARYKNRLLEMLEILKDSEVFPALYYRMTRSEGYLIPPIYARELILGKGKSDGAMSFFELMFRQVGLDGTTSTIKLELDRYEIEALISELQELLEE